MYQSKASRRDGKSPMEIRALDMAEAMYESRGLSQDNQIEGVAHILVRFAENELRLAREATAAPSAEQF